MRDTWRLANAAIVGLALIIGLAAGVWLAPNPWPAAPAWLRGWTFQAHQLSALIVALVEFAVVAAVVLLICKGRRIRNPLSSFSWNLNRHALPSIAIGIAFAALVDALMGIGHMEVMSFTDRLAALNILLYIAGAVAVQPFVEECYFRGILFMAISTKLGRVGTVTLTAFAFALVHVGGYRLLPLFFSLGVVAAIVRIKTRSVASCFAFHAAYNFALLVLPFGR